MSAVTSRLVSSLEILMMYERVADRPGEIQETER